MSRATKISTAKVRDSRKKRTDFQNVPSEPYLTPLTRLRRYKEIRSQQKMEDVIVLNGDSHHEETKPIVKTNVDPEITVENGFQNGNDIDITEEVVYEEHNEQEIIEDKTDEKDLNITFESVDCSDVIEIVLQVQDEQITESKVEEKFEPVEPVELVEPVTPEPVRREKYVSHRMSGRRPLRGINSPHPASKRKADYDENNDSKRTRHDSPSASSPGWRYFQSPSFFWKHKEDTSKNPNDSMVVNIDDTSIHHFEDSKFEADLQQPKNNWKICNIM